MNDNLNKPIFHWSYIMDKYRNVFLNMSSEDLGILIQEMLQSNVDNLHCPEAGIAAINYLLMIIAYDENAYHYFKEAEGDNW